MKMMIEMEGEADTIPHIRYLVQEIDLSEKVRQVLLRVFGDNEEDISPSNMKNIAIQAAIQAATQPVRPATVYSNLYLADSHCDVVRKISELLYAVYSVSISEEDALRGIILTDWICHALTCQKKGKQGIM